MNVTSAVTSYSGSVDVNGVAGDVGSGIAKLEYQLDGGAAERWTPGADGSFWLFKYLPAEGSHRLTLRLTDQAGNVTTLPDIYWVTDTTAPTLTLDATPAAYVPGNFALEGQVSDLLSGIVSFKAQLDGGAQVDVPVVNGRFRYLPPFKVDGTADGYHFVSLWATDKAGFSTFLQTPLFILDTKPPALAITNTVPAISKGNVTVTGQVEGWSSYAGTEILTVQLDGGRYLLISPDSLGKFSYTTSLAVDGSADGVHRLQLRVTDRAGNVTALPEISFILDTQAPTIVVTEYPAGFIAGNPRFRGTVSDLGTGVRSFQAIVDGTAPVDVTIQDGHFEVRPKLPLDGSADVGHRVQFRAVDGMGRVTESQEFSWRLNVTPPSLRIDLPTPTKTLGPSGPMFSVLPASEQNSGLLLHGMLSDLTSGVTSLQVQLDGGTPVSVTFTQGRFSYSQPITADGTYPI